MPDFVQDPVLRIPALLIATDGKSARCFVEIWNERSSAGKTYTRSRITDDPPELPDGEYMVEFAEQSLRTIKRWGKWQLVFLAPDFEIEEMATEAA